MLIVMLMLTLMQSPGEQTRGAREAQEIIVRPDGFDVGIHWGELAAMCTVLSVAYFIITKAIIAPMIEKKLASLDHRFVTRGDLIVALKTSGNEEALQVLAASWAAAEVAVLDK